MVTVLDVHVQRFASDILIDFVTLYTVSLRCTVFNHQCELHFFGRIFGCDVYFWCDKNWLPKKTTSFIPGTTGFLVNTIKWRIMSVCATAHVQWIIGSCIVSMVTVFKSAHFDRFCGNNVVFSARCILIGCIFGCDGYFLMQLAIKEYY